MEKKYYVSDRILGVYFRSIKQLENYYYNAVKNYDLSSGYITELKTTKELVNHIKSLNNNIVYREYHTM